ncbi:hypothetical protein LCL99_13950 [Halomonas denitrificans]|uniref:cyclophilin-like fold protein n=1 Tax=Halomonas denitrificans TaxID=370769 RepID=UPI001CD42A64|nr:cyclophilin-like fold protein [Halomonas denitrificans]MCA0975576.1 hypothetical protein [Halomonas denitrificans]
MSLDVTGKVALVTGALACVVKAFAAGATSTEIPMKIQVVLEGQTLAATLEDSPAARAFADLLPLELDLADYHGIEKIADLPVSLPTDDAPSGIDPEVGDITLYAPWGNLAIFYRDFGYARGLVRLGRIDGSTAALEAKGPLTARIERMDAEQ